MPRHPPRALSSFNHHSITATTRGLGSLRYSLIRLLMCVTFRDLMLTKNRPDAGRLALGHQRSLSAGVAIRHYRRLSLSVCGLLSIARLRVGGIGGAEGTRTPDPSPRRLLPHLSYSAVCIGKRDCRDSRPAPVFRYLSRRRASGRSSHFSVYTRSKGPAWAVYRVCRRPCSARRLRRSLVEPCKVVRSCGSSTRRHTIHPAS